MKSKNKKILNDFIKYCKEHPEERFWQALRSWSEYDFIYIGDENSDQIKDTFYWEGKNEKS